MPKTFEFKARTAITPLSTITHWRSFGSVEPTATCESVRTKPGSSHQAGPWSIAGPVARGDNVDRTRFRTRAPDFDRSMVHARWSIDARNDGFVVGSRRNGAINPRGDSARVGLGADRAPRDFPACRKATEPEGEGGAGRASQAGRIARGRFSLGR